MWGVIRYKVELRGDIPPVDLILSPVDLIVSLSSFVFLQSTRYNEFQFVSSNEVVVCL